MCGIVGILDSDPGPEQRQIVRRMADSLVHRGPDDEGFVSCGELELGFRRLAIIDPEACSQPFSNEDGSVWTACNGQIYNSEELRRELEGRGHRFKTDVDTEVIPHLWEEHGPDLVHQLNGMFALAVWDTRQRTLLLGRDRAGEKPLFYWRDRGQLVFASELRAILAHPGAPRRVDPGAISSYLLHGFFPAPATPFAGIQKLPAAHLLVASSDRIELRRYWDLADHFPATGETDPRSADAIVAELDARMALAVRRRSKSDVAFGVFLSGGIDSSTVLSYVSEQQGTGVPVFALGHGDRSFDESRFAADTARHFQADYHELVLEEGDLADGLRRVGEQMDEPLGDASTIPTYLLACTAREHVKVILSGEGADELFGGYPTYLGNKAAELFLKLPPGLRRLVLNGARRLVPVSMGNVGLDYLLHRFASGLERQRIERHHLWFGCIDPQRQSAVLAPELLGRIAGRDPFGPARAQLDGRHLPDALAELLYTDFVMYLQDDLLTKVDRATMLASLEARAPFLDHELSEFVAGIPSRWKVRRLTTKAILRRAVRRRLPAAVLSRRKRGFNIPFSRWVLTGLGADLRERFSRERVEARGLLSFDGVQSLLDEHLSRQADHRKPLFTLLAMDLWCDQVYGEGALVPVAEAALAEPSELQVTS